MHLPNRLWTNTNNDIILPAVSAVQEVCASPDSFPIRVSISNSMRKQRCTEEDSWAESCFGSYKSSCLVCLERIAGLVSPPYSTDTTNTPARAVDRAGEAGRAQNTSMPHARPCRSCLCLRQLPAACPLLAARLGVLRPKREQCRTGTHSTRRQPATWKRRETRNATISVPSSMTMETASSHTSPCQLGFCSG